MGAIQREELKLRYVYAASEELYVAWQYVHCKEVDQECSATKGVDSLASEGVG